MIKHANLLSAGNVEEPEPPMAGHDEGMIPPKVVQKHVRSFQESFVLGNSC